MENSDFDRVLGRGGGCRAKPKCQSKSERRRGDKPTAGERSLRDRANECLHRDVLLLTPQTEGNPFAGMESQAACQGVRGLAASGRWPHRVMCGLDPRVHRKNLSFDKGMG